MKKFRLLDLFCKAGGASMGYSRAGFSVVGVDIEPQRHYPFRFFQGDALEFVLAHGHEFDAIHASPPCQRYSRLHALATAKEYPMLIEPVRAALLTIGKPYVIENVPGAPLRNPLVLCGTMFGLRVIRHRLFENNFGLHFAPASCNHWGRTQPASYRVPNAPPATLENYSFLSIAGHSYKASDGRIAMGIDWMNRSELSEAIPPAYTEFIGRQLIKVLKGEFSQ